MSTMLTVYKVNRQLNTLTVSVTVIAATLKEMYTGELFTCSDLFSDLITISLKYKYHLEYSYGHTWKAMVSYGSNIKYIFFRFIFFQYH